MSKPIHVDEETYAALVRLKREGETFDDVVTRLLDHRRGAIRAGAGYWSEDDAEVAREKHQQMSDGVGGQWDR